MQYGLSTLFLLFVVLWSSLAVFGAFWGISAFVILVGLAISIGRARSWMQFARYVMLMSCLALLALFLFPAPARSRQAALRYQCANHLKQLVAALDAYHRTNGCFPLAYLADKSGRPMHSWRVLILPFMQLDSLYKRYDFNEPWNGPNNQRLLSERPAVYACPSDENARARGATCTSYVAVVGAHAAWQPGNAGCLDSPTLQKRAADTVLLIEDNSGIQWTEPRDFSLDDLEKVFLQIPTSKIRAPHLFHNGYFHRPTPRGTSVACVDGGAKFLDEPNLKASTLAGLLTIGRCTDDNIATYIKGDYNRETPCIHWPHCFTYALALAVWLASVGLLLYRAVRSRKGAGELAVAAAGGAEAPMNTDKHASDQ